MTIFLVFYDDTEQSKKALNKVIDLVHDDDQIIILTVIPVDKFTGFETFPSDTTKINAQRIINETITKMKNKIGKDVNVIGLVREGDIGEEILKISDELKCNLIVIGEEEITKIGKFALGSVTEKVLRHATCPVLVVR